MNVFGFMEETREHKVLRGSNLEHQSTNKHPVVTQKYDLMTVQRFTTGTVYC